MRCHHPMSIKNGNGELVPVPCGRCMPCRVNHAQEWSFRIEQEMELAHTAHFITLTYSDEDVPRNDLGHTILVKSDFQKFLKRLRYHADQYYNIQAKTLDFNQAIKVPSIRYYLVGEYGEETFRAHGHAIIFNIPLETLKYLERIWRHGHVKIGTVTPASIKYVTKYITKIDSRDLEQRDLTKPFQLMSKGLGSVYVNDESREYHSRYKSMYTVNKKYKKRIGKFLEKKIHDTEQKQKKLDIVKKANARKAIIAQLEEEQKLRSEGVDLHQHYEKKMENENLLFNKNHKRNKL